MTDTIQIYGAGLAGSEAAWQAVRQGVRVRLYEMKPEKKTPAHHTDGFAELVCSNSLRSAELTNGVGLLKEELRRMGSLIMEAADASRVAAGGALAVDRTKFSDYVTEKLRSHPLVEVISAEMTEIPEQEITVVATGPLTSDALAGTISRMTGGRSLYFYDAAAPIVDAESVDMTKAFFASRYGKGGADYINCPMTEAEYKAFYEALLSAEEAPLHDFEAGDRLKVFEGCMPVEVMARRGEDTLRYGPMKPVGIRHPDTDEEYYAVVQLRRENDAGTMYNLVGFQTHLRFPEQKRVFSMIPALAKAEFLRYGVMHRNTFLDSPRLLDRTYADRRNPLVAFAGQMTGVEGYVESTASGYLAAVCMAARVQGEPVPDFPAETAIGALGRYISDPSVTKFQPMNVNFGILPPLGRRVKGKANKNLAIAERALAALEQVISKK